MSETKKLIITITLSLAILFAWQYFYEAPRLAVMKEEAQKKRVEVKKQLETTIEAEQVIDKDTAINSSKAHRVEINNGKLAGSINLKGLRIDDMELLEFNEKLDNDEKVTLFYPSNTQNSYFTEIGFLSDGSTKVPNSNTLWHADRNFIRSGESIKFTYDNGENVTFKVEMFVDDNYMFHVKQFVLNNSGKDINIIPYIRINRNEIPNFQKFQISHEGPLTVTGGVLKENSYDDLKSKRLYEYNDSKKGDWIGIGDKYWLTSIIPVNQEEFELKMRYSKSKYQVDYTAPLHTVPTGHQIEIDNNIFVGAKKVKLLDQYAEKYHITLFDRAVDFGWFYFLTKPIFNVLQSFDKLLGNFGLAILLITVCIKVIMFPLANKSYKSMSLMKKMQPEITRLREKYANDKMQLNKAIMELYAKKKVNPLAGCLPLVLQIPVFFSLYKVIFITIEMRHAPFYGWIHDLSAPDPTNLFNLFGLIPWNPPALLAIGLWPIIMAITMYFQQKLNPEPSDPVQAQVMKFLPLIFVFMFGSFPAGLIIYWAWSNVLSIMQQWFFMREGDKVSWN